MTKRDRGHGQARGRSKSLCTLQTLICCIFGLTAALIAALLLVISMLTVNGLNKNSLSELRILFTPNLVAKPTSEIEAKDLDRDGVTKWRRARNRTMNSVKGDLAVDSNGVPMDHIRLILGGKTGLRQNLRVIMTEENSGALTRPGSSADRERLKLKQQQHENGHENEHEKGKLGTMVSSEQKPWAYLEALEALKQHPLHQPESPIHNKNNKKKKATLADVMTYIDSQPVCSNLPIFLTMATVGDDLYWQLIENFVYTMVKFEISDCSLVICVSDEKCMRLCEENRFPCYDYQSNKTPLPSIMEQIGEVKLRHIPMAMAKGVRNTTKLSSCLIMIPLGKFILNKREQITCIKIQAANYDF
jgi:hypothetical protein